MEPLAEAVAPLSDWAMYLFLLGWAVFLILLVVIVGRAKGRTADLFLTAVGVVRHD